MANRTHLTAPRIEKLTTEKAQDFLWDDDPDCLGVRVTRKGAKSFVFEKKFHAETVRVTIGSANTWKIPDARIRARELAMMVDKGIDPRKVAAEEKAKAEEEAAKSAAMKQPARNAWNTYLATSREKWSDAHYKEHLHASQEGGSKPKRGQALTKPGPLASLLCKPLAEITAEVVLNWLEQEKKSRPTAAGNAYRKLRTFINWCARHPEYKHVAHGDCCLDHSVKEIVPKNKTKPLDCLLREQLAPWFEHVRQIDNPTFSAYLQALLLTGARRSEMLLLKWEDVDFQWRTLRLYDTEDDTGERKIPLTPYLTSLLDALPRVNEWVFATRTKSESGHIIGVTKPHKQALKKAGIELSIHGLRRSFGTLSEWVPGVSVGVVAQIEGRKPSAIAEKYYRRRDISFLREQHEKIETWMLGRVPN